MSCLIIILCRFMFFGFWSQTNLSKSDINSISPIEEIIIKGLSLPTPTTTRIWRSVWFESGIMGQVRPKLCKTVKCAEFEQHMPKAFCISQTSVAVGLVSHVWRERKESHQYTAGQQNRYKFYSTPHFFCALRQAACSLPMNQSWSQQPAKQTPVIFIT